MFVTSKYNKHQWTASYLNGFLNKNYDIDVYRLFDGNNISYCFAWNEI